MNRTLRKIGNAPCSWGVIERTHEAQRSYGYDHVLDEIHAPGFVGTELGDWGFMPTDPEVLKEEIQKRNLVLCASWVMGELIDSGGHANSIARALRAAHLLSAVSEDDPVIVLGGNLFADSGRNDIVGRVTSEYSMSGEQWKIYVEGIHKVARSVREETGLRTVFHPHCCTWVEAPAEIDELLKRTDPELVGICLDTGHYRFGGGDPVLGLREHADRIWHVHFKDCDPLVADQARKERWEYNVAIRQGLFCELGKGDVDFEEIVSMLTAMHYDGWIVVEQDVLPSMGAPKQASWGNREFLRSIGL